MRYQRLGSSPWDLPFPPLAHWLALLPTLSLPGGGHGCHWLCLSPPDTHAEAFQHRQSPEKLRACGPSGQVPSVGSGCPSGAQWPLHYVLGAGCQRLGPFSAAEPAAE